MSEDFKTRLVTHAKVAIGRAERATSEEATCQYLVLPFFQLLGYDPLNPDEIVPQDHASFADKFKNRVDYAIYKEGKPVIAVECKKVGELKGINRGEIKGYFNAVQTVKLGILTDGLTYELFTDTGAENMMDDEPFARLDLRETAEERIDQTAMDAVMGLSKEKFDPATIGAEARRKIFYAAYIDALDKAMNQPAEDLVRLLMDSVKVEGKRTSKLIQEHTPLVKEAIQGYMDRKILERVGFANRQDIVRATPAPATESELKQEESRQEIVASGIETTEAELFIYDYICKRLSFLVKDEDLFSKISDIKWVDHKTVFCIYYKQERKGRLFNFREGTDPKYRFDFGDEGGPIETNNLADIDAILLRLFTKRVGGNVEKEVAESEPIAAVPEASTEEPATTV